MLIAFEKSVLEDLKQHTGLRYDLIEGIPTTDRTIAAKALPILAKWVAAAPTDSLRGAIYSRFLTTYARLYFDQILEWWRTESEKFNSDLLTQIVARLLSTSATKVKVWKCFHQRSHTTPFDGLVLVKLLDEKTIENEVEDYILDKIIYNKFALPELELLAKKTVKNARLNRLLVASSTQRQRKKVGGQTDNEMSDLLRKQTASSEMLCTRPQGPSSEVELESLEIEPSLFEAEISRLFVTYNLINWDSSLTNSLVEMLSSLRSDEWLRGVFYDHRGLRKHLWLRMEDSDVIEVWLTRPRLGTFAEQEAAE